MQGCLHLKSAATFIPPDLLLVNPAWVDPAVFGRARVVPWQPTEPFGANTLTLNGVTLVSADYPATQRRLEAAGVTTRVLEVGELHKAEAALTCMSLILEAAGASGVHGRAQRVRNELTSGSVPMVMRHQVSNGGNSRPTRMSRCFICCVKLANGIPVSKNTKLVCGSA